MVMTDDVRVLIVEPAEEARCAQWIKDGFPKAKLYGCQTLTDYKEALLLFKPDLVLSVVALPDYDGREALAYTKKTVPDTPVVLLGELPEHLAQEFYETGVWNIVDMKEWRVNTVVSRCIRQKAQMVSLNECLAVLQESEEQYRGILDMAPIAIAIYVDGFIRYINPAGAKLLGAPSAAQVMDLPLAKIISPDLQDAILVRIRRLAEGATVDAPVDGVLNRLDGALRHVELMASLLTYENQNAVQLMMTDVTERKKVEADYKYLSLHDHLTDLYNRRYFENEVRRVDVPENLPITIIHADMDGLKRINDTLGHELGDIYITKAAETIKAACRPEDTVARIGGDEFAVILLHTDCQAAHVVTADIKCRADGANLDGGRLSISLGCATKETPEQRLSEILTQAENDMYRNKRTLFGYHR